MQYTENPAETNTPRPLSTQRAGDICRLGRGPLRGCLAALSGTAGGQRCGRRPVRALTWAAKTGGIGPGSGPPTEGGSRTLPPAKADAAGPARLRPRRKRVPGCGSAAAACGPGVTGRRRSRPACGRCGAGKPRPRPVVQQPAGRARPHTAASGSWRAGAPPAASGGKNRTIPGPAAGRHPRRHRPDRRRAAPGRGTAGPAPETQPPPARSLRLRQVPPAKAAGNSALPGPSTSTSGRNRAWSAAEKRDTPATSS